MTSRMGVSTLVVGMFITGCANSLLTKFQDKQCVEGCEPGSSVPRLDFEQPVWQTLNMFIGEFFCCLPLIWAYFFNSNKSTKSRQGEYTALPAEVDGIENDDEDEAAEGNGQTLTVGSEDTLSGWRVCWMWFPAVFDICGTTLMNVGLILTPVSIFQMTRGALVLWVGILSVIFLRRRLWLYQWTSLIIVTLGVCLVGLSGSLIQKEIGQLPHDEATIIDAFVSIARRSDDDPAKVALGVALITFAQLFTATQYVVEEKIMSRYHVEPLVAVSLEGFFGLVTTLVGMPLLHVFFRNRSPYFDVPRGWQQIISNKIVLWSFLAEMISVGSFNFFGLSVTSRVSATTRSTIDTCRTLGIWIVSLAVGWELLVFPVSLLQVTGFALLVYGTFVFNGLIAPLFGAPPASIHLPHEPELEETGQVPAAQAQGRAGYDVVPDDEQR